MSGAEDAPVEWFDVVDAHDRVLTQRTRDEVHAEGLLHRAVSILVFNGRGELLIQERSMTKDQAPGKRSPSASGHVDAGEDYDDAAVRELWEEVGLRTPLERLHRFEASPETAQEFTMVYRGHTDDPPRPDPREVAGLSWHTLDALRTWLDERPEDFTGPARVVLGWYLAREASR